MKIFRKTYKTLSIVVVTLLVVMAVGIFAQKIIEDYEKSIAANIQQRLLAIARLKANDIEKYINSHQHQLQMLAGDLRIKNAIISNESAQDILESDDYSPEFAAYNGSLGYSANGLYRMNAKGIVQSSIPFMKGKIGADYSQRPGVETVIRTHKLFVSEVFQSFSGEQCISICCPVFKDKRFIGIVRTLMYLKRIGKLVSEIEVGNTGYAQIIDDDGTVIAHPQVDQIGKDVIAIRKEQFPDYDWTEMEDLVVRMSKGEEGVGSYHSVFWDMDRPESVKKLSAFTPINLGNELWSLGVTIGFDEISKPAIAFERNVGTASGLLILVLGGAGLWSYRVQKEKTKLAAEAKSANELRSINKQLSAEIVDRKQAEARAERLVAFGKNNPAPVLRTEESGIITHVNPSAENLFDSDIRGESIMSVLSASADTYSNHFPNNTLYQFEQRLGDEIYLFSVKRDESVRSVYVYGSNITETKRLEKLESRAARLEMAGTIAGQVAHDFNNLLAPMMAFPEFIREQLPHDHPTLKYLHQIERAAQKIADINQQLLSLGRRGHYNLEVLNLNTVINQAITEIDYMTDDITCTTELDSDLMNIIGGSSQINRVITNLLCNAVDALQDIGHIIVKTENYDANDRSGAFSLVPKGEYVKLTITDTGCGMSDDLAQQILDPFFTTKTSDKRRGSGLGMSVVDSVIKDHNGYLDMETMVGKGTSFFIYFPITSRSVEEDHSDEISGGNEKILVVDDDETQRDVSAQLLKRLGYDVSSVESGESAIEILRENQYDLIILDMVMTGGIDGAETYNQIQRINPHQKAIFVSGFSESERVLAAQEQGAGAFVRKPLTKKAIAIAVRTELDKKKDIVTS